ncbi:MAG: hypothetical protein KKA63_01740 [Gammaproteobacteria bacterium]|nr:hypothetical protein [Gammaproteobacteria bacterium]
MSTNDEICCPRFDPEPWDGKTITWQGKRFMQDRVTSLFHIPLNYGAVMTRMDNAIRAAGAKLEAPVMLTDEDSLWGADVFMEVGKDVPGAKMVSISGTFMGKVFEGPFSQVGQWVKTMRAWLDSEGKRSDKLYFYYTTCPKCAKKYGKNYVVLLAHIA